MLLKIHRHSSKLFRLIKENTNSINTCYNDGIMCDIRVGHGFRQDRTRNT